VNRVLFVEVKVVLLFFWRKVVDEVPDTLDNVTLLNVWLTQDLVP